jgi:hypothetical protein
VTRAPDLGAGFLLDRGHLQAEDCVQFNEGTEWRCEAARASAPIRPRALIIRGGDHFTVTLLLMLLILLML